jgi:protein involved in polysaccharide export with SLBB domain
MRPSTLIKSPATAPFYRLLPLIAGALLAGGLTNLPAQNNQPIARTNTFSVGDAVRVTFTGTPIKIRSVRDVVRTNGTVTLFYNEQFDVAGKTLPEVAKEIRHRYVPAYSPDSNRE